LVHLVLKSKKKIEPNNYLAQIPLPEAPGFGNINIGNLKYYAGRGPSIQIGGVPVVSGPEIPVVYRCSAKERSRVM